MRLPRLSLCLFALCPLASPRAVAEPDATTPPPRLAVLLVVDQFRADYLERFEPHFPTDAGFRRLLRDGVRFTDCHHLHAVTQTAVGHASIATGAHPCVHGIIGNEWRDTPSGPRRTSVEDAAHPVVGAVPGFTGPGRSPAALLAPTLGDALKRAHPSARVVTLSNKDRSALLLAGPRADAAYWTQRGRLITSSHYRADLPTWVRAFNAARRVESVFGRTWDRLLAPELYDRVQNGPDDAPGEEVALGLPRTFPKRIDGGLAAPDSAFYAAHDRSPFGSDLLADAAFAAIAGEALGQDDTPDLLGLSFSAIDSIGHAYGPDSHEMMDAILRLDLTLARLLAGLDDLVGPNHYVLVLTSDHGVCPLPENVSGHDSGRFVAPPLDAAVAATLAERFSLPPAAAVRDNHGYRLDPARLGAHPPALVLAALRDTLLASPHIAAAWTRAELLDPASAVPESTRLSYHAGRGQDLVFVLRPYHVDAAPVGTNHGTPHDYDTHVPLLWLVPGRAPAAHADHVGVESIAPTLAALLSIPPPALAVGQNLLAAP
jgi:hypothetical protein